MHYTDNPIRDAENYQADQEEWLESRPVCDYCNNYVTDEHYYAPEPGIVICNDCILQYCNDYYKVDIEEN